MNRLEKMVALSKEEAQEQGLEHTPKEIQQQMDYWEDTASRLLARREEIASLLFAPNGKKRRIILTGAGSSDFVGKTLEELLRKRFQTEVNAYPSTSLLVSPSSYLFPEEPLLMIYLARSGNSPESEAVFHLAERLCLDVCHLVITCNPKGRLVTEIKGVCASRKEVLLLAEKTNDQGLAMTASFSNMLVATLGLCYLDRKEFYEEAISNLTDFTRKQFPSLVDIADRLTEKPYQRIVFLGDAALQGIALESALKVQELTDGNLYTLAQSFLGLRHGPESSIQENSLVVAFLALSRYIRKYEEDLLRQLEEKELGNDTLVIGPFASSLGKYVVSLTDLPDFEEEAFLAPFYVVLSQLLALFFSQKKGLKPDSPSARGAINRVVQGVQIYPYSSPIERK